MLRCLLPLDGDSGGTYNEGSSRDGGNCNPNSSYNDTGDGDGGKTVANIF